MTVEPWQPSYAHWWRLAGYCMRNQQCPEIVGPIFYYALGEWRFDLTSKYRASDDGMPE